LRLAGTSLADRVFAKMERLSLHTETKEKAWESRCLML